MLPALSPLVFSAFLFVASILFAILSCTAVSMRNSWPLMSLLLNILAAVPLYLCGGHASNSLDAVNLMSDRGDLRALHSIGLFLTGFLAVAGPGLSVVLYHTGVISGLALSFSLISALCFGVMCMTMRMNTAPPEEEEEEYDF